jgi:hypothetical protein
MLSLLGFVDPFQEGWMVASVGILISALVVLVGFRLLRLRRSLSSRSSPKEDAPKPEPFYYGSSSEKRAAFRREGRATKVYISDVEKPEELCQGWVVERSLTGLRLMVPQAVPPNAVLSVHAVDAPQNVPWIQVSVVRCSPLDDRWELGCQFVRTPPFGELLQFN